MAIHVAPFAVVLTTSPTKIFDKDLTRKEIMLQNQDPTAIIYRTFGGNATPRAYIRMVPNVTEVKDQYCPTDEIWAFSDTNGTILTVEITTDS